MTKTMTRSKSVDAEKALAARRMARRMAGANHPAVKQFSAIVRDAVLLRKRIDEWTRAHDAGGDSPALVALAAATECETIPGSDHINGIMRQLFFLDCTLETTTEVITGYLYSGVMPECFPNLKGSP